MLPNSLRRGAFAALLLCAGNARAQQTAAPSSATPSSATPSSATPSSAAPVPAAGTNPSVGSAPVVAAGAPPNAAPNSPVVLPAISPRDSPILAPSTIPGSAAPNLTPNLNQNSTAPVAVSGGVSVENSAVAAPNSTKNEGDSPKSPAFPARGTLKIEGDADNLSVFAVSVDAAELLTAIAARARLKLVVDDTISRRITMSVSGKPAREVISSITGAYGLAAAEVEGVTLISEGIPRTPSSYLLSDIDQISTKYVDASNARNLLPVFLQDYVKVNGQQNAVVLSAPAEVLRKFRADIAGFDIPASQILVDLLLVELTDSGLDQLNLTLNFQNSGNALSISPSSGSVRYRALTTLPDTFASTLSALQESGRARVRANPRIATVSGRRASIFVGRQRYIVTPIDTGNGQRNFIDAGVRLEITPFTGGEKQIIIDVNAEVSTLSAVDPVTRLPEKSTRTTDTKVRVSDGQTIVIGGLEQSETRDVETRVPILGNIPLLGPLLFRSRDKRRTNTQLVLFVTPRILSDTGHLPAAEENDIKKRFLAPDLSAPLPPAPSFNELPANGLPSNGLPSNGLPSNALPGFKGASSLPQILSPVTPLVEAK